MSLEATTEVEVVEQVEETVQEATPAETQVAEDAAFEKGFNVSQGIEEAPAPEPTPEPEPAYTTEQVKELMDTVGALKQREAKVFGTLGSLKQQIDSFKSAPPSQQAVKLTADKLKRLSAEFPEMAQMLSEDLNEALQGGNSYDPSQMTQLVEQTVNTRLEESSRKYEAKLLSIQHPDWKTVVASPEFTNWAKSLPPEEIEALSASWDAEFIAEKLKEHKDWKSKTVQKTQSNQRRLEAAITPRGNPQTAPTPSAEDAFTNGFKKARGLR